MAFAFPAALAGIAVALAAPVGAVDTAAAVAVALAAVVAAGTAVYSYPFA